MNSKLILAIIAGLVVAGGLLAVKNLTSTDDKIEVAGADTRASDESDSSDRSGISDNDDEPEISAVDRDKSGDKPGAGNRKFSRGEGAAALQVTPATTTPLQAARAAATTPQTTTTEESKDESRQIADLVNMFRSQSDPDDRIDTADELGLIDNPDGIRRVLELLKEEKDPSVQIALLEAMQGLDALEPTSAEVYKAVAELYPSLTDPDARIAAQDLMGDVATPEAVAALRNVVTTAADPHDKLNATENLMRIRAADPDLVPQPEAAAMTDNLKEAYNSGPDAAYRQQAIMALAIDGRDNLEFFQQAIQTEQDQDLRQLLERLVRMYTQAPRATPPPGAAITPAPTPDVQ